MLQGCRDCGRFSSLLGKPSHAISRMEASRNDNRQQTVAPNPGHKYADRRIFAWCLLTGPSAGGAHTIQFGAHSHRPQRSVVAAAQRWVTSARPFLPG